METTYSKKRKARNGAVFEQKKHPKNKRETCAVKREREENN
jgi:hypothetical protein